MAYYCDQECCVINPGYEYDTYYSDEEYMCSSCNTNGSYHELTSPEPHSPHSSNKPKKLPKKSNTKHADPQKNHKLKKTSKHLSSKSQTMTITPKDSVTININFMFWPENDSSSTFTSRPLKKKRHRSKKQTLGKNTTVDCATTCPSPTFSNKEELINDVAAPETTLTMQPIIYPPAIDFHIAELPQTMNFPSNNFKFTKMTF